MIQSPYLLFLGDAPDIATAKTAAGIRQWRPELCAGQLRLPGCKVDLGLPDLGSLTGPTAVVVGGKNPAGVAKILKKFIQDKQKLEVKIGVIEKKTISAA